MFLGKINWISSIIIIEYSKLIQFFIYSILNINNNFLFILNIIFLLEL